MELRGKSRIHVVEKVIAILRLRRATIGSALLPFIPIIAFIFKLPKPGCANVGLGEFEGDG